MYVLKQICKELNHIRPAKGNCLCTCRHSEILVFIRMVLILSGIYHAIGHILVLLGMYGINDIEEIGRKLYFSWDLAVSISSWSITQKNTPMVILHALIHIGAVGHLFNLIPTTFYAQVFQMGELDFDNKQVAFIVIYVWGTTQDISNHLLNCYYLFNHQQKENLKTKT